MGRINYSYNYLLSLIANRPLYRYTDSVMDSTTVLSRMSSGRQNSRVEYSTNHLISQQSGVSESDIESRIADALPLTAIKIEAESFNTRHTMTYNPNANDHPTYGLGVGISDGVTYLHYIEDGMWWEYELTSGYLFGTYNVEIRLGSGVSDTASLSFIFSSGDGSGGSGIQESDHSSPDVTFNSSLTNTGSWSTFDIRTMSPVITIPSGTTFVRMIATDARYDIDWFRFIKDTIDPTAVLNITSVGLDVTVSLTSISENNCTIRVYSDSGYTTLITSATTTTETSKDLTFTESSAGTYTYYVRITDESSNFSDYSASIELTEISTPSAYLDTLTADSTISGIASDGAPSTLSGLYHGVVYITGNFTSSPSKVMFEAGGTGQGIIIYVKYYNTIPYLYAQCGDGSVSGGDVELVWEVTSSFSTVIVSFCNADVNGGVNRLYVDDILRDTQNNGSYENIAGPDEGGAGNVYNSYAVNRLGTVDEFGGGTITTTKIYKNMTLDPDDF